MVRFVDGHRSMPDYLTTPRSTQSAEHLDQLRGRREPTLQRADLVSCIQLFDGVMTPTLDAFE